MNKIIILILSLTSGTLLGLFYFGGLWLTLKHLPDAKHPALLTLGSFLGRSMLCLFGFYLLSGNGLEALAYSLAGFILSKLALIWRLKSPAQGFGGGLNG